MKSDPTDPLPAAAPRPALWFVHVASWVLAAMAAVAFLDVVLRIAGRPITGAYELTALLMGLPSRSTVRPTMRPGICRMCSMRVVMKPK